MCCARDVQMQNETIVIAIFRGSFFLCVHEFDDEDKDEVHLDIANYLFIYSLPQNAKQFFTQPFE